MLADARDIWALCYLDKQLSALREHVMVETLRGAHPHPEVWVAGEAAIARESQQLFYNADVERLVHAERAVPLTAEAAYAERTQGVAECAALLTHRVLAGIPFVGQPGYEDV